MKHMGMMAISLFTEWHAGTYYIHFQVLGIFNQREGIEKYKTKVNINK